MAKTLSPCVGYIALRVFTLLVAFLIKGASKCIFIIVICMLQISQYECQAKERGERTKEEKRQRREGKKEKSTTPRCFLSCYAGAGCARQQGVVGVSTGNQMPMGIRNFHLDFLIWLY